MLFLKCGGTYLPDLEKQDGSSGAQLFPAIINRATLV